MEGLSISSQENYVKEDINVVFNPNSSVTKYEYTIYKDNIIFEKETVTTNQLANIILNESGSYKIEIKTFDLYNNEHIITSGNYNIDKENPIIELNDKVINMQAGDVLKPLADIKVYDAVDGDLLDKVITNIDELDLETPGIKTLTYTVSDAAGNEVSKSISINVVESTANALFLIQLSIICILTVLAGLVIFFFRSMRLEKRLAKYSVEPLKDTSAAIFDNFCNSIDCRVIKTSKTLKKFSFFTKYSKRYDKYVGILNKNYGSGIDFVSAKVLTSLIFVIIAIFSKTFQYELLGIYEVIFPLLIGFFMLDVVYFYKYRLHLNKVENDLLQAIIVMNNAFKSGRSITQAIILVTTELEGAIAEEFKKMHLEISFGLSVDVVFKRFSERIKLEEVTYLTASLSILNKTGGNIIKVFSSIEKSLFDKKKLKLELASLTGSSKLIVYALFCIPILFVIFVSLINPGYFKAFYTTNLGGIVLALIVIMYLLYMFVVRKIMKVRM